jgi:hypothetical protein
MRQPPVGGALQRTLRKIVLVQLDLKDGLLSYRRAQHLEICLNYWTFATSHGAFSIVERASRGVDLFFDQHRVGHYRNPVEAAEQVGKGNHPALPCAPEDGKTLGVPLAVHEWTFVRQ